MLYKYLYKSKVGAITLLANDYGLLGAWFGDQENFGGTFDLNKVASIKDVKESPIIENAASWLDNYFKDQPSDKVDFQLMPQGTALQQDVWDEMKKIPYGQTIILEELADRVANRQTKGRGSLNAVERALTANPIAIIIPSHRVKLPNDKGSISDETSKALITLETR